jgi:hypothetical protein
MAVNSCRVCRVKRVTCRLKSDGGSSVTGTIEALGPPTVGTIRPQIERKVDTHGLTPVALKPKSQPKRTLRFHPRAYARGPQRCSDRGVATVGSGTVALFPLETVVDLSDQAQNDLLGFVPGGFFLCLPAGERAFRNRAGGW